MERAAWIPLPPSFFGPPDGVVTVKPYTYEDLVAALNQVVPYDWNSLLQSNLLATRPTPVSPGLEAAGWTVVYTDEPNQAVVDAESTSQQADLSTSIGLVIEQDGTIVDVAPDSAAGRAGLAPASKLMGVNHRVYSADLLRQAIVNAETTSQAIELLTLTDGLLCRVFGGLSPGPALAPPYPNRRKTGPADDDSAAAKKPISTDARISGVLILPLAGLGKKRHGRFTTRFHGRRDVRHQPSTM